MIIKAHVIANPNLNLKKSAELNTTYQVKFYITTANTCENWLNVQYI